jgi:hypothetical protein
VPDLDHYEAYYAAKLWALLPAVYRAQDAATLDGVGSLRELVNRIGVQAAILRRSIDRLWEDQSIETCDDWVIPYIGSTLPKPFITGAARARSVFWKRSRPILRAGMPGSSSFSAEWGVRDTD